MSGSPLAQGHEIVAHHELGPHNTIFHKERLVGFIDWDDAAPGTRLRDLANAIYNFVDVSHWANQEASEHARRIDLMCTAYGWNDPIALINDFEADLQQALRFPRLFCCSLSFCLFSFSTILWFSRGNSAQQYQIICPETNAEGQRTMIAQKRCIQQTEKHPDVLPGYLTFILLNC